MRNARLLATMVIVATTLSYAQVSNAEQFDVANVAACAQKQQDALKTLTTDGKVDLGECGSITLQTTRKSEVKPDSTVSETVCQTTTIDEWYWYASISTCERFEHTQYRITWYQNPPVISASISPLVRIAHVTKSAHLDSEYEGTAEGHIAIDFLMPGMMVPIQTGFVDHVIHFGL